jgi:hypothetical protein
MELNILKVDLDIKFKSFAINTLIERLSYMHDLNFYDCNEIKKIELIFKTTYGCKIYLKSDLYGEKNVIIIQLLLGSDFMKEINTMLNHFKFNMNYSNRMFDCKRYKGGQIKIGKIFDVTVEILKQVLHKQRKKYRN